MLIGVFVFYPMVQAFILSLQSSQEGSSGPRQVFIKVPHRPISLYFFTVFKYCSKTWTECTEFAAKYNITLDKDTVDKFHTPIFVYRGDNNAIEGLAIINPVENNAQITADTSWTNRSLTRTAERYLQHMAQKNNKTR